MVSTLSQGDLGGAKKLLNKVHAVAPIEKRILAHMEAKLYLFQGSYEKVIQILEACKEKYGVYIGQLCDLMVCYYNINNGPKMVETMESVEHELSLCQQQLSFTSRVKTLVLLAKMQEETGEIKQALQIYQSLLSKEKLPVKDSMVCLAQVLRVKSLYGVQEGLSRDYQQLNLVVRNSPDYNFMFEVEHGLFLSEVILFGMNIAEVRLKRLLSVENLLGVDKSLLLFDCLEVLLRKKDQNIKPFIKNYSKDLKTEDELECFLLNMANQKELSHQDFIEWHQKIPLGQFLRLYLSSSCVDFPWAMFLISGVKEGSQKIWRNLFDNIHKKEKSEVEVFYNDEEISSIYGEISLSRKANLKEIFFVLIESSKLSKDELIQKVWKVKSINPSHEERLRTALRRINKDFKTISGHPLVKIKKTSVELAYDFSFKEK